MPEECDSRPRSLPASSVRVLAAAGGNEFMLQIARILAWGFEELGVPCELAWDAVPQSPTPTVLQLVVAPHEFVPLFLEHQRGVNIEKSLGATWCINVEQPGAPWFEVAWRYARFARGIFDINEAGVRELRRRGADATHVPLGYAPFLASPSAEDARDIDILFIGHASARREAFLARHAAFFASRRCALHLVAVDRPRHDGTPGYLSGTERGRMLSRSRIVLNVHSAERRYFESHRAMLALANRCLFVTETSDCTAPLLPGVHFLSAPLETLAETCEQALDGNTFDRVADTGHRFVLDEMSARHTAEHILRTVALAAPSQGGLDADARPGSSPARVAVQQRIAEARSGRAAGQSDFDDTRNAPYAAVDGSPAITVLVSLFNYEQYVGECVQSVAASQRVEGGIELVVIDDASTDGSTQVVERLMGQTTLPMRLLRKRTNTGLADTRNLGLQAARGRAVFVLDADNWIYPSCLPFLWHELQRGKVAATYGLIQRFDDETGEGIGLMSQYEWDVRDLVRAPYIDAMALIDRRVALDAGGYALDLIDHGWFGWEDYAMWLALAQTGHAAKLVPQIVAGYRVHRRSMIHRTNESSERLAIHFHDRFAKLVSAYPDLDGYFGFPRRGGPPPIPQPGADPATVMWQQRCDELAREVNALRTSASWKVTAPLRALYSLVTGRP